MSNSSKYKVGFVILNYCTWNDTIKCISSIRSTEGVDSFICVVDNNSPTRPDKEVLEIIKKEADVLILHNRNDGYNAGNNVGLRELLKHDLEFFVIINSDVVLEKNSILLMIESTCLNNRIGIVGPRVMEKGQRCFYGCNYKKDLKSIYQTTTFLSFFHKNKRTKLHNYLANREQNGSCYEVFSVSGCCFLLTKECVASVYPFDQTCKLYNEENMLGVKMEQLCYKTIVNDEAIIYHEHGASTKSNKANAFIQKTFSDFYYALEYLKSKRKQLLFLYALRKLSFIIKNNKSFNPSGLKFPKFKILVQYGK